MGVTLSTTAWTYQGLRCLFLLPSPALEKSKKTKKKNKWNIFQFLFSLIQKDTNPKCCKQTEQNRTKIEIKWRITLKKKKKPRMACDATFFGEKWIWYAVAFVLFYFIHIFFFLDFQIYYFICFSVFLDGGRRKSFRNVRYD
jgi:hypothetical protein